VHAPGARRRECRGRVRQVRDAARPLRDDGRHQVAEHLGHASPRRRVHPEHAAAGAWSEARDGLVDRELLAADEGVV
jgi:hypothetical protein